MMRPKVSESLRAPRNAVHTLPITVTNADTTTLTITVSASPPSGANAAGGGAAAASGAATLGATTTAPGGGGSATPHRGQAASIGETLKPHEGQRILTPGSRSAA
jgi:hypothetical protein